MSWEGLTVRASAAPVPVGILRNQLSPFGINTARVGVWRGQCCLFRWVFESFFRLLAERISAPDKDDAQTGLRSVWEARFVSL